MMTTLVLTDGLLARPLRSHGSHRRQHSAVLTSSDARLSHRAVPVCTCESPVMGVGVGKDFG
jgi:hypothetical protein